jgi:hypothetical protein
MAVIIGQADLDHARAIWAKMPAAERSQAWERMTPTERDLLRDNSDLTPQLTGLEGHRVEVMDIPNARPRRFIVGKSTGWRPCHLELARVSARGGEPAAKAYESVRSIGKVR